MNDDIFIRWLDELTTFLRNYKYLHWRFKGYIFELRREWTELNESGRSVNMVANVQSANVSKIPKMF